MRPAGSPPPATRSGQRERCGSCGYAAVRPARPTRQGYGCTAAASTAAAASMPIRIKRVDIRDGTANFTDHSVEPNFSAGARHLHGSVTGLSSAASARAKVTLEGSVDQYAPVTIQGELNPLAAATYTDMSLSFQNIELTTFNPYSGKFAGYNIAQGKLSTELHYHVENRKLDASHHVVIDQLEFGAATESKQAVPLPIKLAVALLKDRNGVITLDLPVSGSIDDPTFKIGPIIWKLVVGLINKIVTAPFAAVAHCLAAARSCPMSIFRRASAVSDSEAPKLATGQGTGRKAATEARCAAARGRRG